jgi:hypothetical protein
MAADDEQTLHRIFERLGGIQQSLENGSRRHTEFAHGLAGLDEKVDSLVERVGKVEGLAARISIIEPALWQLESRRLEAAGVKKFFGQVFTKAHMAYGIIAGSIGAVLASASAWLASWFPHTPPHP